MAITGTGTLKNPYKISLAEDLQKLENYIGVRGIYLELTNDIDMKDITNWIPIGYLGSDWSKKFKGTFDGKGFTIRNFTYSTSTLDPKGKNLYAHGFFASIGDGGIVMNVNFENVNFTIDAVTSLAGIIVGDSNTGSTSSSGSISNVQVSGIITINSRCSYLGSIIGRGLSGTTINQCYSSVKFIDNYTLGYTHFYSGIGYNARTLTTIFNGQYINNSGIEESIFYPIYPVVAVSVSALAYYNSDKINVLESNRGTAIPLTNEELKNATYDTLLLPTTHWGYGEKRPYLLSFGEYDLELSQKYTRTLQSFTENIDSNVTAKLIESMKFYERIVESFVDKIEHDYNIQTRKVFKKLVTTQVENMESLIRVNKIKNQFIKLLSEIESINGTVSLDKKLHKSIQSVMENINSHANRSMIKQLIIELQSELGEIGAVVDEVTRKRYDTLINTIDTIESEVSELTKSKQVVFKSHIENFFTYANKDGIRRLLVFLESELNSIDTSLDEVTKSKVVVINNTINNINTEIDDVTRIKDIIINSIMKKFDSKTYKEQFKHIDREGLFSPLQANVFKGKYARIETHMESLENDMRRVMAKKWKNVDSDIDEIENDSYAVKQLIKEVISELELIDGDTAIQFRFFLEKWIKAQSEYKTHESKSKITKHKSTTNYMKK